MLIDKEPEMPSELEAEEAKLPELRAPEVPELPDRYRGKSIEDIVKMLQCGLNIKHDPLTGFVKTIQIKIDQ